MQSSMVDLTLSVKTTQQNATILFVHGTNPSNNTEDIAAYLELFIMNGLIGYRFSCDGVLNETLTTNAFVATGDEYRIRIRWAYIWVNCIQLIHVQVWTKYLVFS